VVLALAAGVGLQVWAGWRDAPVLALLAGLVAARFVPARSSCSLERPPESGPGPRRSS
jgi:hypothetical protein